ncbi:hypothetical protein ACTJJ0_20020 [Chitinophaga sp. 22321]|uniref:DUF4919 domain-containing protein n=1 Tax=Chitinophaga hostae TaxID=2831022 RepID=A0ABS5IX68_9BACT|nr:hypothetical protein [Chitinophaga hostae]MBS0027536.1 hypothetical protein [Chitinophaga hostae]
MKRIAAALMLVATCNVCWAQEDEKWQEPSKATVAYQEYREKITRPPYGLEKVSLLIKKIKDDDESSTLPQKDYLSLSLREKFTYHMIHAESYSQNCDAMPPVPESEKKIFAQLPDPFGEYSWSERQMNYFKAHRDTMVALMTESIGRSNRVGVNYKKAIVEINGKEMIPLLINTYNRDHKDKDILTLLMILMKNNEYTPFLTSASYKKLFSDAETSYRAFLNFNTANEELIIQRATTFYNGLPKKG